MDSANQSAHETQPDVTHEIRPACLRWLWLVVPPLLVLFMLGHSFTSLASYDDESYVMLSMQTVSQGQRLYAETYSQYGPAFYLLQVPIHDWLGVPVTHDVVRIKTILAWLLVSLLSGCLTFRVTKNPLTGWLAVLLTAIHLDKLGLEPAHPQELIALMSALALLLVDFRSRRALLLAGVCAGLAGLTKLNAGAILAGSVLLAVAWGNLQDSANRSHVQQAAFVAFASFVMLCLALPLGVMAILSKAMLAANTDGSGQAVTLVNLVWPLVMVVSATAVCGLAWHATNSRELRSDRQEDSSGFNWSTLAAVVLGGMLATLAVVGWSFTQGNSVAELVWGLLKQHSSMTSAFYAPVIPDAGELFVIVLIAGTVGWLIYQRVSDRGSERSTIGLGVAPVALLLVILMLLLDCWKAVEHGMQPHGASRLLAFIGPMLMPLMLIRKVTATRLAIAISGCLGPLLAYPVSGTQLSLGTVSALVGLLIATHDAVQLDGRGNALATWVLRRSLPIVVAMTLIATVCFGFSWFTNTPLDQPGCRWVRLTPDRAEKERAIADAIRQTPGNYLAFDKHNHNRFFFWTDKQPVTAISPTFWPRMLNDQQQVTVRDALTVAGDVCVVKTPGDNRVLSIFVPEVEQALFRDWQLRNEVDDWQIGLRPAKIQAQ